MSHRVDITDRYPVEWPRSVPEVLRDRYVFTQSYTDRKIIPLPVPVTTEAGARVEEAAHEYPGMAYKYEARFELIASGYLKDGYSVPNFQQTLKQTLLDAIYKPVLNGLLEIQHAAYSADYDRVVKLTEDAIKGLTSPEPYR